MSYLLDTCCISELVKAEPDKNVVRWFSFQDELDLYLSVITLGELQKGIERLPSSRKRDQLSLWVSEDLQMQFRHRILDISHAEVKIWGKIQSRAESAGTPIPAVDALIAATALSFGFAVVTRNTDDMEPSGVEIINPWMVQ